MSTYFDAEPIEHEAGQDPVHIGEVLDQAVGFDPPTREAIERQNWVQITTPADEIDDLAATRASILEQMRAGHKSDDMSEKLRHVTDALLTAQADLVKLSKSPYPET